MDNLEEQLIQWRRDFHRHPEQGYLEIRTASIVADTLERLGYDLQLGKKVMNVDETMGRPSEEEITKHVEWARNHGAIEKYILDFKDGYTGIVATLDTGREGPTFAFRVDMDALPILEASGEGHFPVENNFHSVNEGSMHACGHDAHTAIGLGLATKIMAVKDELKGRIKIIFQPAEEGTRGAKSMVRANVVDNVDYFIASHIGTGVPNQHFIAANDGFLATSKLNITFKGVSSHAGGNPEQGNNALLAAAAATLHMHAISRHSGGASRVHVGKLQAGSGRNIIASDAFLMAETRGETNEINEYIKESVIKVVKGAAQMYGVSYEIDLVGEAISCKSTPEFAKTIAQVAKEHPYIKNVEEFLCESTAGSEDATYFMEAVQSNGGSATYCIFGTDLAAGHHNEWFDINEDTLLPAVEILFQILRHHNDK